MIPLEYSVKEVPFHRFVYDVTHHGQKGDTTYRVDLIANLGASACTCEDWSCRRAKLVREHDWNAKYHCKHCDIACYYLLRGTENNGLLHGMAKELGET